MYEAAVPRAKSLLEHFSEIRDDRQPCKVMYPLGEVLLLVVGGTMAACDDYDDIVLWGERHLGFLRRLQEFHHGIPCADWLRVVMNRTGPVRVVFPELRGRAPAGCRGPDCQSALNIDPVSASKSDPPFSRYRERPEALRVSLCLCAAHRRRAPLEVCQARFLKRQLSLPVSTMSQ